MSKPLDRGAGSAEGPDGRSVNVEIVPVALRAWESEAARQQRIASRLQASYLLVLLAAPAVRLVPVPVHDRSRFYETASALLLLAAVGSRLLLRRVAADADWVRARRESEAARSAAWRRCVLGRPDAGDAPLTRRVGAAALATRWAFYRRHRIDDQIEYFAARSGLHRRLAARWRTARLVLTVGTVVVASASLVVGVPGAAIGPVATLLAATEAWIQFRRSEVLASSFAEAGDELGRLRLQEPADEESLAEAVDAVELALERERWTWTAIMSVAVLTSSTARPPATVGDGRRE